MSQFSYIDIFAGCGGLSLGLHNAGWKGLFAIEKSKDAFETLKYNLIDTTQHFGWNEWLPQTEHDINEVISKYRSELEKLAGTVTLVVEDHHAKASLWRDSVRRMIFETH